VLGGPHASHASVEGVGWGPSLVASADVDLIGPFLLRNILEEILIFQWSFSAS
jgi:hypothetical protein